MYQSLSEINNYNHNSKFDLPIGHSIYKYLLY